MKILFLTDNFPPEVNAPASRTYEHAIEWIKHGAEVTVITCNPNFPQGKIYDGYKNKLYQTENFDGIKVIRVWSYMSSNKGTFKRILDYQSFAFMAFWTGLFRKTDIIIATSPQFFTTWAGRFLSLFKRKPWVFELRDLWPESIKTVGAMKEGFAIRNLEKIELALYRNADLIVPVTSAFKENLITRGVDADKQVVIQNGANLDLFKRDEKGGKAILEELNLQEKFVVGYIGTHGMAHSLDFILSCLKDIEDKDIHFLFIGDGAVKEGLIKQAERDKLENVTFHNPVPKEKIPAYLSAIDVSLVPLKKSDTFKTVIPSKIFEAAAMQVPILLGVEGESQEIIEKYDAGLCFEPENKKDFLEKLMLIKTDNELYKQKSENGKKLATAFDRKVLAKKMLDALEEVVKNR